MKNIISLLLISIIVSACAGSAQHQVVSANRAGDANLDCRALDAEIVRAQVIIDLLYFSQSYPLIFYNFCQ